MSVVQDLINAAAPGAIVKVPPGEYPVDAVAAPIRLKSDITFDITSVKLKALPNDQIFSLVLVVNAADNVKIIGGLLEGERDTHLGPTDGSLGGGGALLAIGGGSRNVSVNGTTLTKGFCDGLLVEDAYNVAVDGVVSDGHRRNGMSVTHVDGMHTLRSHFTNCGGTPNGNGIDFEAETPTERIINVDVDACIFAGNQGSDTSFSGNGTFAKCNVVSNNSFDGTSQPIWTAGNAASLGTPWWAFVLNRLFSWAPFYRWWGYPTSWSSG